MHVPPRYTPSHAVSAPPPSGDRPPRASLLPIAALLNLLLLLASAVFLGLHFVHLTADFPNHSRWMDWSKYTDEGWYGDAAIRHAQLGHWYQPGDFNPAVALPVWPLLEAALFTFTGVSLAAARALTVAVFAATMLAGWLLIVRRRLPPSLLLPSSTSSPTRLLPASTAVLLLAVSPFCFVFTRLAILEPLLVLLTLLALLAAQSVSAPQPLAAPAIPPKSTVWIAIAALWRRNLLPLAALALLFPLIILTKTTGTFLVPAVLWMLFAALEFRLNRFAAAALPVAAVAAGLWLLYFLAFVRPHYLLDYRYLFSANAYTGITRNNFFSTLWWTLHGGFWTGRLLYTLALAAFLLAAVRWRSLRATPLVPALLLWALGYAAFLAYHNNLQPRYYLVIAVPLALLVPVAVADLLLPPLQTRSARFAALAPVSALLLLVAVSAARQTLGFVLHPQYTFVRAAQALARDIRSQQRQHPGQSPLILSISGADLSLITGLPSICDDFGTLELSDRVQQDHPGWYVSWNQIDDDTMDTLDPLYRPVRIAAYPAFDDPDRNLLILYRLDPAGTETRPARHRRQPIPKKLQTRVGQQPTPEQLEH